jgi:hypothetical protein
VLLALAKSIALVGTVVAAKAGRRVATTVATYLVVGAMFAVSLCFLTLAAYRAMVVAMGEVYASLIVGCAYLVAGLVVLLIIQFRRR